MGEVSDFVEFTLYVVEKFLDIRRVRDRERQEMRRVGECHVPDTIVSRGD